MQKDLAGENLPPTATSTPSNSYQTPTPGEAEQIQSLLKSEDPVDHVIGKSRIQNANFNPNFFKTKL